MSIYYQMASVEDGQVSAFMGRSLQVFADSSGVAGKDGIYRIDIFNLAYLGQQHSRNIDSIVSIIKDHCATHPEDSVALVILPNTPRFGITMTGVSNQHRDAIIEQAREDVKRALAEPGNDLLLREVCFFWDLETMKSHDRSLKEDLIVCCSSQQHEPTKTPRARAVTSNLWRRRAVVTPIPVVQRLDYVDPTVPFSTFERGNLSKYQERKQWITGEPMYKHLLEGLWSTATQPSMVFVRDYTLYDCSLLQACASVNSVRSSRSPTVAYAGVVVWQPDKAAKRATMDWVSTHARRWLHQQVEQKSYNIPGLRLPAQLAETGPRPSCSESNFVLCFPRSDGTLPIRQSVYDEWSSAPADLKDAFNSMVGDHDKDVNPSGTPWKGHHKREGDPSVLADANAITIVPAEGDAATLDDLVPLPEFLCLCAVVCLCVRVGGSVCV